MVCNCSYLVAMKNPEYFQDFSGWPFSDSQITSPLSDWLRKYLINTNKIFIGYFFSLIYIKDTPLVSTLLIRKFCMCSLLQLGHTASTDVRINCERGLTLHPRKEWKDPLGSREPDFKLASGFKNKSYVQTVSQAF
ncbi:UNVERIFIED_CONTAM: hypothetical protein K2H54_037476 [Gekko kuhli]